MSPDDLVIRSLEPDDVETLAEIAVTAWEQSYAYYRERMGDDLFETVYPDWRASKADQIRQACADESRTTVRVAELDGRVSGFVTFFTRGEPPIGEIGNNAVHPDAQGRGIGTALYRHTFDRLRERGVTCVTVATGCDPGHAPARHTYEKVGFDVSLPTVRYYREL